MLKKLSLKLHNLHWTDAREKAFMQTKQTYIGLYAETSKSIDVPKWQKQNTGNCKSCHALFKHYCSYKYSKVHDLVVLLFQSGALICKSLGPIFLLKLWVTALQIHIFNVISPLFTSVPLSTVISLYILHLVTATITVKNVNTDWQWFTV